MKKPDFDYYRTVVSTQHDPDILQSELKDLINESVAYIEKAAGSKVPCSDWLLLKLLEEMRTETVECLWDHANAEDLDKQTCESMASRLEDFFNQKIYDIKRKQ